MGITKKDRGKEIFGDVQVLDDLTVGDDVTITGDLTVSGAFTASGSLTVKRVSKTANYTTSDDTIVAVDTSGGAVTITLATADTVAGRVVIIKDEGGQAGTNAITIATEGSETIDGSASTSISTNYGVVRLYSDGTNWFTF